MQRLRLGRVSHIKSFMKLFFIIVCVALISCKKQDPSTSCSETGTLKKGSTLGLMCTDVLFIVRNDNKIIEPVITHDLLNGLSEGKSIRFGHKEIFLGIKSCGENIETAELTCVDSAQANY
jgi:hypothetical protein